MFKDFYAPYLNILVAIITSKWNYLFNLSVVSNSWALFEA